jgi:hypothetical protein
MGENLRRFVPRSFRYVLRAEDRKVMRFSLAEDEGPGGIEKTLLLNMSETGVAFLVSSKTSVSLNERIMVEIPIPNGDQLAWWGRVVRLQEYEPRSWAFGKDQFADSPKIIVGVRFDTLPEGHSRALRKGIEASFMKAMRDQQYRNWVYYRTFAQQYLWKAALAAVLIAFTIGFIWFFTRPSSNYDPVKGAPWGERFKF